MKRYLGDGCYADWDGYHIWLVTEDGIQQTNEVALDVTVLLAFEQWLKDLRAHVLKLQEEVNRIDRKNSGKEEKTSEEDKG